MLRLIVIVVLTLVGTCFTNSTRPAMVESSPIVGLEKKSIPKVLNATQASVKAVSETFTQPVAKAAPPPLQSVGGDIESIVRLAARKYGVNEDRFLSIARCESTLNPNSVNTGYYAGGGNPSGLFQFLPDTFARMSANSGGGNIFDPVANANAAAWGFANGRAGEWECH